jgi:mono/diheme cytochrome c family protein
VGAGPRAAIVKQIRSGGNGMPPFQGTLDDKAINDVAAYVESLGKGAR